MLNADLAAVSRKNTHATGVGHPLRNRSASSSADGRSNSRGAADPGRYAKYLSLRNRKIIENKHRGMMYEDTNSSQNMNTGSHRTLDN